MSNIPRRQFAQSLAAAVVAAPAIIRSATFAATKTKRLPLAFSTLGCPAWEWRKVIEQAAALGYVGIELRGLQGEMDLPKSPQLTGDKLKESLKDLAALDLRISDLGASAMMHEPDPAKRAKHLDEARRFIDLAHQLKAPYVRVFPNQLVQGEERAVTVKRIADGLRELGEHARGSGVVVILESHGEFNNSPLLLEVFHAAKHPNVAFLWDAHHTCVAGEKPAETFKQLGSLARHTHLKDSVAAKPGEKDRHYVLTGKGDVPVKETVKVLTAGGYRGLYCFEWEKRWHPEIEEPEIAFPHYAKVMSEYLAEAGYKA